MNNFGKKSEDAPGSIFFYRHELAKINTTKKFDIKDENGKLRVRNENVNCLFSNLTALQFDQVYNEFNQNLNLDFDLVTINGKDYFLNIGESEKLIETIITNWIYFYTINNLPVEVKQSDFTHPYMVDYVLAAVDKKYGIDTEESLVLGSKIVRQPLSEYKNVVSGRRRYYDR